MNPRRELAAAIAIWFILSIVTMALVAGVQILPDIASQEARIEDSAMVLLTVVSMPVLMFVVVGMGYSAVRFRARPGDESDGPAIHSHRWLQGGWLALTTFMVLGLFAYGAAGLIEIRGSQTADFEVHVMGEQWKWTFDYTAYGVRSDELHLPVGQRAHLIIESKDVIHSLWLPSLGIKQDAVPGHPTQAYVSPTVAATFDAACTELCGFGHSSMTFTLVTSDLPSLDAWAGTQRKIPPPKPGQPSGSEP